MPPAATPNARIRARVEHVFAAQKRRFALMIRTVGNTGAAAKRALANLAYTFTRFLWLETRQAASTRRPRPRAGAITRPQGAQSAAVEPDFPPETPPQRSPTPRRPQISRFFEVSGRHSICRRVMLHGDCAASTVVARSAS